MQIQAGVTVDLIPSEPDDDGEKRTDATETARQHKAMERAAYQCRTNALIYDETDACGGQPETAQKACTQSPVPGDLNAFL